MPKCVACGTAPRGHAAYCRINTVIRRIIEGGDGDYKTICERTGLTMAAAYQRVRRLGLSRRMEHAGEMKR